MLYNNSGITKIVFRMDKFVSFVWCEDLPVFIYRCAHQWSGSIHSHHEWYFGNLDEAAPSLTFFYQFR